MISFCCPSRGRPLWAKRLVDSATATQKGNTEFLFYLNDDDRYLEQYKDLLDEKHYVVGPNQSTCFSWNLMAEKATNDVVMLMGDDVQVKTENWDQIIVDEINKYDDIYIRTRLLRYSDTYTWHDHARKKALRKCYIYNCGECRPKPHKGPEQLKNEERHRRLDHLSSIMEDPVRGRAVNFKSICKICLLLGFGIEVCRR